MKGKITVDQANWDKFFIILYSFTDYREVSKYNLLERGPGGAGILKATHIKQAKALLEAHKKTVKKDLATLEKLNLDLSELEKTIEEDKRKRKLEHTL